MILEFYVSATDWADVFFFFKAFLTKKKKKKKNLLVSKPDLDVKYVHYASERWYIAAWFLVYTLEFSIERHARQSSFATDCHVT